MSIRRFRDVADMPGPRKHDQNDPDLWRRIRAWMALSNRLSPRVRPAGIYKSLTIEEANLRRQGYGIRARRA
jgi:hypothetical protein